MKTDQKNISVSSKSCFRYLYALPLGSKLYLCIIPILGLYLLNELTLSFQLKILTSSIFLYIISLIFVQDFKQFKIREAKLAHEKYLLEQVEKSLASLQETVEDIEKSEQTKEETNKSEKKPEKDEFKIPVPDCAVILGANNTASYVIPYNFYSLATHEVTALKAASNVLKKKGLTFQILQYKPNHPFFENSQQKVGEHIKALQQFPPNFLNYN